jgi:hypothetical protein
MIVRKLIKEHISYFMYNNFQGNNRPHYNLKTSQHNKFFVFTHLQLVCLLLLFPVIVR